MSEIFARGVILIFDSDVLIWFLRGNENAQKKVLSEAPFKISAVTYMELVQGMKDKRELATFKKLVKNLDIEIVQIDSDISAKAIDYVEEFYLSNSFEMGDALIAATCVRYGETLCTANDKHYKVVSELVLDIFRQ